MKFTVQLAYDRTVPIIISEPRGASLQARMRSASGFFVEIDSMYYLGTAHHVWLNFIRRKAAGEDVIFQAGRLAVAANVEGLVEDATRDIVLIPVDPRGVQRSGQTVSSAARGWPPPLPKAGSYVIFSGCPESLRDHDEPGHVGFGSFSSLMRVTDVDAFGLICEFERGTWIWDGPNNPPQPGDDLSGMSGGPVFAADDLSIPLVGLIKKFGGSWEMLHVATLAGFSIHSPD